MTVRIYNGDCRQVLGSLEVESVHCVVTSPPYWGLRDYGVDGQLGLEATPEEHVERMVGVFREVRRVLRGDGTLWLNYGDCYAGSQQTGGKGIRCEGDKRSGMPRRHRLSESQGAAKTPCASGLKPKDLVGMPWRVAFGLQSDGWYLRSDIIWAKPNPMPESVTDRPTKSHEHVFLLAKSQRYHYDADAVREDLSEQSLDCIEKYNAGESSNGHCKMAPDRKDREGPLSAGGPGARGSKGAAMNPKGRNLRDVWTIATHPYPGAHFATFPPKLVIPCIKAGCPEDGTVLDPFGGAGTVGLVADRLDRHAVLIDVNETYVELAATRIRSDSPMFSKVEVVQAPGGGINR